MKLATLRDDTRDGQLAVVSRDLKSAVIADAVAGTLQRVLDDWAFHAPQLQDLYAALNDGRARNAFAFEPSNCLAPLPRAYQWLDASAYPTHLERLRAARGIAPSERGDPTPSMYPGGSDGFLAANDEVALGDDAWELDFEAEVAVVTDAVAFGAAASEAAESIRLVLLVNDWTLRDRVADELAKGLGFVQAKPASAFAPVAVTPDELGEAWQGLRLARPLRCERNGERIGEICAAAGMQFDFGELLAHAARTRALGPGTILGAGAVSSPDSAHGSGCLAEARALEILAGGEALTAYLRSGDRVRIDMCDADGHSIFGPIDQRITPPPAARAVRRPSRTEQPS